MRRLLILLLVISLFSGIVLLTGQGCSGDSATTSLNSPQSTVTNPTTSSNETINEDSEYVKGQVVVRIKNNASKNSVASLVNGKIIKEFSMGSMKYLIIQIPENTTVKEAVKILNSSKDTDYAEPDYIDKSMAITPNDPKFQYQYCHENMQTNDAWDITTGSDQVTIAIIDTGVDGTHPDLAGRTIAGYDFIAPTPTPIAPDTNSDPNGHGTHVAGIAAATGNNNIGVAGMNWKAKIIPVRVLNEFGSGPNSIIAYGIAYASLNGANVINLSLGGKTISNLMRDAITIARMNNVTVFASMGNDDKRQVLNFPAGYPGVIAIGSTDAQDNLSIFSTVGPWMSVSAPGSRIISTYLNGGYGWLRGTSMACPQVTGLASLIKSAHMDWTPEQIRSQIEGTVDDLGDAGYDPNFGFGRINAKNALGTVIPNKYGKIIVNIIGTDGNPASGVNVLLKKDGATETVTTALSDAAGNAYFFDVPASTSTYAVSANLDGTGLTRSVSGINVQAGQTANASINFTSPAP